MILLDTSVWAQKNNPHIARWFASTLLADEIAVCDIVVMELLQYESRAAAFESRLQELSGLPTIRMSASEWRRAREVQHFLANQRPRSLHRSVKISDLLIAACAENAGVGLVHYDHDFETIKLVTGQEMVWIVPRGSIG